MVTSFRPLGGKVATHRISGPRLGAVVLRGLAWGAATGGGAAATAVTPRVVWNGPPEALLVYPPLAGIAGATLGAMAGAALAPVVAALHRRGRR